MNLLVAPKEIKLELSKIRQNKLDKKQLAHLNNLGFVTGAELMVVSEIEGSVIVNIKGCRVGLGKELAECIRVIPIGG